MVQSSFDGSQEYTGLHVVFISVKVSLVLAEDYRKKACRSELMGLGFNLEMFRVDWH